MYPVKFVHRPSECLPNKFLNQTGLPFCDTSPYHRFVRFQVVNATLTCVQQCLELLLSYYDLAYQSSEQIRRIGIEKQHNSNPSHSVGKASAATVNRRVASSNLARGAKFSLSLG